MGMCCDATIQNAGALHSPTNQLHQKWTAWSGMLLHAHQQAAFIVHHTPLCSSCFQAGKLEVLIDGLPGTPDGLARAPDGNFWAALLALPPPASRVSIALACVQHVPFMVSVVHPEIALLRGCTV